MVNAIQNENLTVTVAVGTSNKLEIGDLVCIHGLTSAVALRLNGCNGQIIIQTYVTVGQVKHQASS